MKEKSLYTRKLGSLVASRAKGSPSEYHIIPSGGERWLVVSGGSLKPLRVFATKNEAILFAKQIVGAKDSGEIIVHGFDGDVLNRISL